VLKVIERKPIAEVDDQTVILADVAEKAIRQVEQEVKELLDGRMPTERATALARTLASGTWTHDYPIGVREARELGLPISTDMPRDVFDLMQLFPQASQRRPSVQYIPLPYGPREPAPVRRAPTERERGGQAPEDVADGYKPHAFLMLSRWPLGCPIKPFSMNCCVVQTAPPTKLSGCDLSSCSSLRPLTRLAAACPWLRRSSRVSAFVQLAYCWACWALFWSSISLVRGGSG